MIDKLFIFLLIFCFDKYYISKTINNINDEKPLYWNDKINLTSIKEEILNYQNIFDILLPNMNLEDYKKMPNPKISLIVPVYNKRNSLLRFYMSICNQSLKDIEIIFINDASIDNSSEIIDKILEKDKRIVHLKTDVREYNTIKKGVLYSSGEYVYVINPDDLLLNNILEKAYDFANNNNLDILQFYIMAGNFYDNKIWKNLKCKNGILHHSQIKNIFYNCYFPNLRDKIIKKEVFMNSLNYVGEYYDNDIFSTYSDDDLMYFALQKYAKSYGFLDVVGYFYNIRYTWIITEQDYNNKEIDYIFKKLFNICKYFLKESKNKQGKLFAYKFFLHKLYKHRDQLYYLNNNIKYFNQILDEFLADRFYNKKEKEKIKLFKKVLNSIIKYFNFKNGSNLRA